MSSIVNTSIARMLAKEDQTLSHIESASIIRVASLGSAGLYSIRRKTGEVLDGVVGPSGLKVGGAVSLGFKDTGAGLRYSPFIIGKAITQAEEVVKQAQSTILLPKVREFEYAYMAAAFHNYSGGFNFIMGERTETLTGSGPYLTPPSPDIYTYPTGYQGTVGCTWLESFGGPVGIWAANSSNTWIEVSEVFYAAYNNRGEDWEDVGFHYETPYCWLHIGSLPGGYFAGTDFLWIEFKPIASPRFLRTELPAALFT